MKKLLLLVLIVVFALPPLLADEASYSFTCEDLYQQGRNNAPKWSKGWFTAGFCITLATTTIGLGVSIESDDLLAGFLVGAGTGMGVSILLPLALTKRPSYETFDAEDNKCYNDGYLCKVRATNTGASFLGSLLGGPAAPVGLAAALAAVLLEALLGL